MVLYILYIRHAGFRMLVYYLLVGFMWFLNVLSSQLVLNAGFIRFYSRV